MADRPVPLVVIGASARAFAASAGRAGWLVHAADLFDDVDLRAVVAASRCVRAVAGGYPRGLVEAVRGFPSAPFCYVGALENHLEVLRAVARDRPLLGCGPEAVAVVRDLRSLRRLVRAAGLDCPECHGDPGGLPTDGSYLRKPLAGAGGRGIVPWDAAAPATMEPCVWQRRIAGVSWSAAYVIAAEGGRLIGASRQLNGLDWCHARPFAYCGSVDVPLAAVPADLRRRFERLANPLVACGLRGAVGVDFVVDADDEAWVVEVNPRPTASMELIERATGASIAAAHVAACGGPAVRPGPTGPTTPKRWAKAVLYAPTSLRCDSRWHARVAGLQAGQRHAAVADIPAPGRVIPAGGPVCTLFACGTTEPEAMAILPEMAGVLIDSVSPPSGEARRRLAGRRRTP